VVLRSVSANDPVLVMEGQRLGSQHPPHVVIGHAGAQLVFQNGAWTTRQWAKREAQLEAVIGSTVGMYADLQGIAGKALPEIEGLELGLIEDMTDEDEAE
jgi:hypothetical protein